MFKIIITTCAVVFFTIVDPFVGNYAQGSAHSTEKYLQTINVNERSEIFGKLLNDLQEDGTCTTGKVCIFRYDFTYLIWSPEFDSTIYVIDITSPYFFVIESDRNLHERVELTTINLLRSLGYTRANIDQRIIEHFPTLPRNDQVKATKYIEVVIE